MKLVVWIVASLLLVVVTEAIDCADWSEYTECTVPCGGGRHYRARSCVDGGLFTSESDSDTCNEQACDQVCSEWSEWSTCSRTCGTGSYKQRVRQCVQHQDCNWCDPVDETDIDIIACEHVNCEVNCTGSDCIWSTEDLGYHYDPLSCNAYYTCQPDGHGGFIVTWHKCPDGTEWDTEHLRCDHHGVEGTPCQTLTTPLGLRPTTTEAPLDPFCNYKRDPENPRKYTLTIGYQVFTWWCEENQEFNEDTCTCDALPVTTLVPLDCDCLIFEYERTADGTGCNDAVAEELGGRLIYGTGRVGQYAAWFNGHTRVSVGMFKGWLDGSTDGALTVSLWMKRDCDGDPYQGIVVNTDCTSTASVDLHLENGTITGGVVTDRNQNNFITFSEDHPIPCDEWTHITMVYNKRKLRLYKNCELVEEVTGVRGRVISRPIALSIGHSGKQDDEFYKGWLDQVEVCRRALSREEIEDKCLV